MNSLLRGRKSRNQSSAGQSDLHDEILLISINTEKVVEFFHYRVQFSYLSRILCFSSKCARLCIMALDLMLVVMRWQLSIRARFSSGSSNLSSTFARDSLLISPVYLLYCSSTLSSTSGNSQELLQFTKNQLSTTRRNSLLTVIDLSTYSLASLPIPQLLNTILASSPRLPLMLLLFTLATIPPVS